MDLAESRARALDAEDVEYSRRGDFLIPPAEGGPYAEAPPGRLAQAGRRAGDPPRLPPGATLDLGVLGEEGMNLFFIASTGAVNRWPDRTGAWYYRAGADKGRQRITLFRAGKGILPAMERLAVTID